MGDKTFSMGRIANGVNGPVTGTVGTIVGSSWKGIPYIKARYKKRTAKATIREAANRQRFAAAQRWLKPLLDYVRQGFKGYTPTVEGFIAAKSHLMRNAMTGVDVDPALALVSFGSLPLAADIAVERTAGGQLQFSWDPRVGDEGHPRDQVMLLAYDVDSGAAFYTTTGQFRSTGEDILAVDGKKGHIYQVYFAFTAFDRSRQSDSVYLGTVKF